MYKTQYAGCEAIGSDIFRRRLRVVKGRRYPIEYSNILNYIVKWPKICRLPNLYIPRTHLKNFLDPRMNIVCLFVHSRFFRVAFCLFLYLNDSFRVRKKWGCNSWPCETQKVISKKEWIISNHIKLKDKGGCKDNTLLVVVTSVDNWCRYKLFFPQEPGGHLYNYCHPPWNRCVC